MSFFEILSRRSDVSNILPFFIMIRGRKTRPALQLTYSLFVAPTCSGLCMEIPTCG